MKNRLKAIRQSRKLTVEEVAKKIGRSVAYVKGVEAGTSKLTEETFLRFCGTYDIMGDEVFGLTLKGIDKAKCDDVLVDCCIWFLREAVTARKAKLSKTEFSKWVVFMNDAAIKCPLNATQLRKLARVVVSILH